MSVFFKFENASFIKTISVLKQRLNFKEEKTFLRNVLEILYFKILLIIIITF